MNTPKKLVLSGLLSAFALIAFMLENLFSPLLIIGGRIGIANFFVLIAGICCGFRHGFSVLIFKAVLGSLLSGNAGAIIYSLPAGAIAYTVQMLIILYLPKASVIAASVVGGVINASVQNAAFCIVTSTPEYVLYMPYLALVGLIGGAIVGTAVFITVKLVPLKFFQQTLQGDNGENT